MPGHDARRGRVELALDGAPWNEAVAPGDPAPFAVVLRPPPPVPAALVIDDIQLR